MSLFPGFSGFPPFYGGWGFPQVPVTVDPLPDRPQKPEEGEQVKGLDGYAYGASWGGLAGYPDAPPGNYATWRLMDSTCPTLTLTKAAVLAPIFAGVPSFVARTPEGKTTKPVRGPLQEGEQRDPLDLRAEFIERMFLPLWGDLIYDCARSLTLGHYPFEIVWTRKEGSNWIEGFAPHRPESCILLADDYRRFVGVRIGQTDLVGPKAFNCHWDVEARNWYGRPRHENVRLEWWRQMQDDRQGSRLDDKAVGNVFVVYVAPNKQWKDETGNVKGPKDMGKIISDQLSTGHSVYVPLMVFEEKDIKANPDLAVVPAVKVERIDLGNVGPAQDALLRKLEYRDKRLVRGWCHPERGVLEAVKSGSRADSTTAADVGTMDSEFVQARLYAQISSGPIDWALALRYGPDARGSVFAKAPPLADPRVDFLQQIILKMSGIPQGADILGQWLDEQETLKRLDVPILDTPRELAEPTPPPANPPPPGNNGNGRMNDPQPQPAPAGQN